MNVLKEVSAQIKEIELRYPPIIIRVNKFDEDGARKFADEISAAQSTGQNIVPVIIDSYGGQVYSLMSMIANIRASKIPVATIVEGKAMSCGAILFSFGTQGYRFMDRDATLMIHDVSSGSRGKIEELKVDVAETDRLNQKVYRMMAANCGKEPDYFLKLVHDKGHADWYLDVDEAMKHGLANQPRIPTLKIKVGIDYTLE